VSRGARLRALATGALGSTLTLGLLRAAAPGRDPRWARTNHAGDPVTLLEGPAYVAGSLAGLFAGGPAGLGPAVAAAGAGAFGALDDLAGDSRSKGLRGHLGALARGQVTTGAVKVAGLGACGLLAAALVDRRGGHRHGALATLVGGGVVAGAANVANLLDLRPGRALKATLLTSLPLLLRGGPGSASAAAAAGAALGALPQDLAGRAMLGDTGANAAGALLGTALLERSGLRGRLLALAVVTGLTVASERVSFTSVIESTPGLRELDALGRPTRG
jgi:UDP-N-acetylmuramyl pentapeptide phosphotransferase/UDP-N-acetylglucosamine-1-phosphate transferase